MKILHCKFKNNRGFTLVEVLVAVVILSIGLLAVAGLQTNSMRSSNNALYRSQAVLCAEDILDRMRANVDLARNGAYDIALAVAAPTAPFNDLAEEDLAEWKTALADNLPGGDGSVALNGNIFTVVVQWRDSFGQDAVVMETRL